MEEKIRMIDRFKWSLNPKKYINLIKDKMGMAFLYIFILSVILGGIQGITAITSLSIVGDAISESFENGKLNFEMKGGVLDFKDSPYKEEEGSTLLLIDTNKTVDEVDSLRNITVHKDLSTVILKDGIVIKNGSEEVSYKYADFGLDKFDFNNEIISVIIKQLNVFKYILLPIIIITKFVDMLLYALMMSLAGMLSILLNKQRLSYGEIFKLSMYSITLPTLINLIFPLGRYSMLAGGIILIFGINYIIFDKNLNN